MDFLIYVLFLFMGILFGSFFGWILMRRLCQRVPGEQAKGLLGALLTLLLTAFSASR